MNQSLVCADVVPGCAVILDGGSEDEVLTKVAEHAASEHGLTDIDDATLAQIKASIRTT